MNLSANDIVNTTSITKPRVYCVGYNICLWISSNLVITSSYRQMIWFSCHGTSHTRVTSFVSDRLERDNGSHNWGTPQFVAVDLSFENSCLFPWTSDTKKNRASIAQTSINPKHSHLFNNCSSLCHPNTLATFFITDMFTNACDPITFSVGDSKHSYSIVMRIGCLIDWKFDMNTASKCPVYWQRLASPLSKLWHGYAVTNT